MFSHSTSTARLSGAQGPERENTHHPSASTRVGRITTGSLNSSEEWSRPWSSTCCEGGSGWGAAAAICAGGEAQVVRLPAAQRSQGAVVDAGVAGCRVSISAFGRQQVGRGHSGRRPCHCGSILLA